MVQDEVKKTISLNGSNSHTQPNNLDTLVSSNKVEG